MPRFRASLARLMMAVTATTLLIPTVAFAGGAVVHASVDCGVGDPPWYEVRVSNKDVLFTHNLLYATLTPDAYASKTVTHTTTFSASITIKVGAQAEAGIIIAKASASLEVDLMFAGSVTDSTSVTIGVTNNTSRIHDYVFFDGTRTAMGTWTKYYCSVGTAKVSSSGTWKSWEHQYFCVLRCDTDSAVASSYKYWSVQYKAVSTC